MSQEQKAPNLYTHTVENLLDIIRNNYHSESTKGIAMNACTEIQNRLMMDNTHYHTPSAPPAELETSIPNSGLSLSSSPYHGKIVDSQVPCFQNDSIDGLLTHIMTHHISPTTQDSAKNAYIELQHRLTGENKSQNILLAMQLIKDEPVKSAKRIWLETLCPQIKYFNDLLKATRDIFDDKWSNQGDAFFFGVTKTPDTIKAARTLILTGPDSDSYHAIIPYISLFSGICGLSSDKALAQWAAKLIVYSQEFSSKVAERVLTNLHHIVHVKNEPKYRELKNLLPLPTKKMPNDFDHCVRKVNKKVTPSAASSSQSIAKT